MGWLADTDILSERARKRPDPRGLAWLEANAANIYTSSHAIGEIQAGIAFLSDGAKKRALQLWLNRLMDAMEGRVLTFNTSVAAVWGRQEAEFGRKGCPMPMPAASLPRRPAATTSPSSLATWPTTRGLG